VLDAWTDVWLSPEFASWTLEPDLPLVTCPVLVIHGDSDEYGSVRFAAQNRIRAVLVGRGLPAPRGARAWTKVGLAGIAQFARPLAECGPDDLWR